MCHTKGPWFVKESRQEHELYEIATGEDKQGCDEVVCVLEKCAKGFESAVLANAQLIAAAPLQNGQLRTGNECLTKVQNITAEIAKTCSPEHAEMLCAAQSYLCGVIAGNEIALAKAEVKK